MGKKVRSFIAPVATIAGSLLAPGIGTALGSTLSAATLSGIGATAGGALGGAASGGGVKGALTGGLTGAALGFAPQIGGFANEALGLGLQNASSVAGLGGALGGAAAGGLTGGGKGALSGALTGGLGGYLSNGGMGEISNSLGLGGGSIYTPGSIQSSNLGSAADANFLKSAQNAAGLGSISSSSGGLSGLTNLVGGGGMGNALVSGLSALNQYGTMGKLEKQQLEAQRRAEQLMQPFAQTGIAANQELGNRINSGALAGDFNFEADPGYQFRKQEGELALQRAQAARGGVFSGAALREAMQLNQDLANQAYQDAFQRDLARQQSQYGILAGTAGRGQNAAAGLGSIYGDMGDIRANATLGRSNALTGFASDMLGGDIIGLRADGTPITRQSALLGLF